MALLPAQTKQPVASKHRRPQGRFSWNLIRELSVSEFKLKYQGSLIGYLWSLTKPLAIFGILYLVFTKFFPVGAGRPLYPVSLLLGIVLWGYFSDATFSGLLSIVSKGDLIRKVAFSPFIVLLASSGTSLITLGINLLVVAGFLFYAGITFHARALLFIPLLIELYVLCLGLSLFLAGLFVRYRDFSHIWEVILQVLFYASAVFYPLDIVPPGYAQYIVLNPVSQIFQDSRKVLIDPTMLSVSDFHHPPIEFLPYLVPFLFVLLGWAYFKRAARHFAEEA